MKLEVKERGSKCFYDEFLSVMMKYKKIIKNPHKKVNRLSKEVIGLMLLSVFLLIVFIILYKFKGYSIICVVLFSLIFILSIIYYLLMNKRISFYRNFKGTIVIEFNNDYIEYLSSKNNYKVDWDNIKSIIINKYSICFIPIYSNKVMIGISTEYKDKVIDIIKKLDKENLIIDNSNLYKEN